MEPCKFCGKKPTPRYIACACETWQPVGGGTSTTYGDKDRAKIRTCIKALVGYRTGPGRLSSFCEFCDGYIPGILGDVKEKHKDWCPVIIARQLEAEWEKKP